MSESHDVQRVAISFADGSVAIMHFILNPRLPPGVSVVGYDPATGRREPTAEAINDEIARTAWRERVMSWRLIDAADVPADRTYRDAWTDASGAITHDMPKAREIHRRAIRERRAAALDDLDRQYNRAAGQKRPQQELDRIEAARQVLRDAPADPRIEAAKTVEELKAIAPS